MTKITVGIADGHETSRVATWSILARQQDIEVILETEGGGELLKQLDHHRPDIVLINPQSLLNSLEIISRILEHHPTLKIIAYSLSDRDEAIIEMSLRGVKSIICKNDGIEKLLTAIRIVNEGDAYFTDNTVKIIKKYLLKAKGPHACPVELTRVETTILRGICEGLSSTRLGKIINKSPRTVEDYRLAIYRKFNVQNKEQLIAKAIAYNAVQINGLLEWER